MDKIDPTDAQFVDYLRDVRGYLILAPGDTSPLGELVSAVLHFDAGEDYSERRRRSNAVVNAACVVASDPAIREWAEKERQG